MDFFELIKSRHSVRSFDSRPVGEALIEKILDAARLAPSAKNTQPWRFFVALDKGAKEKVVKTMAAHNQWAMDAGAIIVVLADMDYGHKKETKNYLIDIGLCLENLLLAAEDVGLGACPCTNFQNELLDKELGLPSNLNSIVVVAVGHKKGEPEIHEKKSVQEVVWPPQ
ncbi:Coenzyme F420:L-glutamate ligase [Candidatus Burarchaeum australiense]|nr:Coenzyme F420:L-glutamate ligase [Candidatus Burarchaeum australiense]